MKNPTAASAPIRPVILSGGVGSRLWPLSRALYPKQLLPLVSETSLLQQTILRVADSARYAAPLIVCNDEHRFIVAEQLREIDARCHAVVLEPEGRNTAPAVAVATLILEGEDPDALLLVLPSDHVVADEAGFHAGVETAAAAARGGHLVTFGITPGDPETGYGYLLSGESIPGAPGCRRLERFIEKPAAEAARAMIAEGGWAWNSGMFLFSAATLVGELARLEPEMLAACRAAIEAGRPDLDFFRLGREAFAAAPARSLDHAVMKRTDRAAMVPVSIGWTDVGSWRALWEIGSKDARGNVVLGDVVAEDASGCYLRSDGRVLAALGVRDLVVVATDDAVLVSAKHRAQDVKAVVEAMKARGGGHTETHSTVYRPWGYYQSIHAGDGFQVKEIWVKPGAKLSLQKHRHRAEHWVVVAGTARVIRGEESFELHANQSTYIPRGTVHRLENLGAEPLRLIEVQSGDYLGEDDIVRLDDVYGRGDR